MSMTPHKDVVQAAHDLWIDKGEPPREYLNGFIRGYREAEVHLPRGNPEGPKLYQVAYSGGYEYSARIHQKAQRHAAQKRDKRTKK